MAARRAVPSIGTNSIQEAVVHKKIIVAVLGPEATSRDAVAFGIHLARAEDAQLLLAAIWESPLGAGDSLYEGVVMPAMEREMRAVRPLVPDTIPVRTRILGSTSVVRGLHRLIDEEGSDVVVFSAADLRRYGHGNLALEALHDAPCAVATVPVGYAADRVAADVAVAWVDTAEARAALEDGIRMARHSGGTLRIVHVVRMPYGLADHGWLGPSGTADWLESARHDGEATLASALEQVDGRVPVTTELREGVCGRELAAAARGCGMIVTGSRGYGALRRLVLGSTTAQLLREAEVPVLTLPRAVAQRDGEGSSAATMSHA
jgi:nucleotide-binding universal stress UspA family protein